MLYATCNQEDAAIKIIAGRQRDTQLALLREMTIMEKARSNYIVRFLGYSVCQDGLLLAMELMQGGNLLEALAASGEYQWYNR